MLKFKVNENMPAEVAAMLVEAGHDALTVQDQQLGGRPDTEIADICQREGRAIFTLDLHCADIRAYPPSDYPAIVVVRLPRVDKNRVLTTVRRLAADARPGTADWQIVDRQRSNGSRSKLTRQIQKQGNFDIDGRTLPISDLSRCRFPRGITDYPDL